MDWVARRRLLSGFHGCEFEMIEEHGAGGSRAYDLCVLQELNEHFVA